MKICWDWLQEWAIPPVDQTPQGCADQLTLRGIETDVIEVLPLNETGSSSIALDVSLTPDRGYCASLLGVSRELIALGWAIGPAYRSLMSLETTVPETAPLANIEATDKCSLFSATPVRCVDGSVPAPDDVRERLRIAGVRRHSALVDLTNYVMLETGQPLHVFDADKIVLPLVVREATPGETLETLDDEIGTITLRGGELLVCDQKGPVALAGIMGGAQSGVSASTTRVVLESASFMPDAIRGIGRRFKLTSEACYRFERGVDPNGAVRANLWAQRRLLAWFKAEVQPMAVTIAPNPACRRPIECTHQDVDRRLGTVTSDHEVEALLQTVGIVRCQDTTNHAFDIPSWRYDLTKTVDLVGETARLLGLERLSGGTPASDPRLYHYAETTRTRPTAFLWSRSVIPNLSQNGYNQCVVSMFGTSIGQDDKGSQQVALVNPMTKDGTHISRSQMPGLLDIASRWSRRGDQTIRLFAVGPTLEWQASAIQTQTRDLSSVRRTIRVTAVATGFPSLHQWGEARPVTGHDVGGDLARAADVTIGAAVDGSFLGTSIPVTSCHRLLSAVSGQDVGRIGQIESQSWGDTKFRHPLWAAEFLLDDKDQACDLKMFEVDAGQPPASRDLSIIVNRTVPYAKIEAAALRAAGTMASVTCFDLHEGKGLPPEMRSVGLRLVWQDASRTLTAEEVDAWVAQVIDALARLGGTLRPQ